VTTFSRRLAGAVAILALIAGCAANRLHEEGLKAVARGDYEAALPSSAKRSAATRGTWATAWIWRHGATRQYSG